MNTIILLPRTRRLSLCEGARKIAGFKDPSALKDMAAFEQSHLESFDAAASFTQPATTLRGQAYFQDLEDVQSGHNKGEHLKGIQVPHAWTLWLARTR